MENDGKKEMITFDIGTNFETELIEAITKYNEDGKFVSVFGKLKNDIIGGGRASMLIPEMSIKQIEDYVNLCHRNNLKFNYLLNPICLGNREVAADHHKEMLRYFGMLTDIGVDGVTVNSPYLCEVLKTQFPHFNVTVGVFAEVGTLQRIKYWEELGADDITLVREVTRNFKLLEKFLKHTRKTGTGLRIFANSVCLLNCPFAIAHATGMSHASQKGEKSSGFFIDHSIMSCNVRRVTNPIKIMGASWIRPEDIKIYERLCERAGNFNLNLKLIDRTKKTAYLANVIKAYATRRYDGNLLDILNYHNFKNNNYRQPVPDEAFEAYDGEMLKKIGAFFALPKIVIDNSKLDGFLERFEKVYQCHEKVCDDVGINGSKPEGDKDMELCSYCRKWGEKAISFDQEEVRSWAEEGKKILDSLSHSTLYQSVRIDN